MRTVYTAVNGLPRFCPDQTFHRYTYTALYERVKRLANALTQLGVIQPGDRVGTYASNTYQHLELYAAIPGIGAVLHPLNVRLTAVQLARIVCEAEDEIIFVDGVYAERFEELREKIECERIVHFHPSATHPGVTYEELLSEAEPVYSWDIPDENWAMGLCYTSGTQGEPRGVLYTHRSMFSSHTRCESSRCLRINRGRCRDAPRSDVPCDGVGDSPTLRCSLART